VLAGVKPEDGRESEVLPQIVDHLYWQRLGMVT
jgi:hypothetical protein